MKWHLVDESSLEEKMVQIGWGNNKKLVKRTFGWLTCGDEEMRFPAKKLTLVVKDTVNMSQSSVCAYCKKRRMKQLGIDDKVIG